MSEGHATARIEAARRQEKHYQGEPCPKGHEGLRYTSTGGCVACTKAAAAARNDRIRRLLAGEEDSAP